MTAPREHLCDLIDVATALLDCDDDALAAATGAIAIAARWLGRAYATVEANEDQDGAA